MGIPRSWGEGPGISDFFPRRAGIFFNFLFPAPALDFFSNFRKSRERATSSCLYRMNGYASWSQHSSASNGASVKVAVVGWLPCARQIERGAFGGCVLGVSRGRAGEGTLELAAWLGPIAVWQHTEHHQYSCNVYSVIGWAQAHPGNSRTRLARASGSHVVLRSAIRTDSDQNHTSQALELAAGGCGNSIKRASDSRTEAPSQPARSSWQPAVVSHILVRWLQRLCRRADSASAHAGCYITIKRVKRLSHLAFD